MVDGYLFFRGTLRYYTTSIIVLALFSSIYAYYIRVLVLYIVG